jgi:hypothetical protein
LDFLETPSSLLPRLINSFSSLSSSSFLMAKATESIELLLDYLPEKSFPRSLSSSEQRRQEAAILSLTV